MFIGKAYNNIYAFLNWYKNISRHLFVDAAKKIIVITDSENIILTKFSNCIYFKVNSIDDPNIVKCNKFKYIIDSTSEDDQLIAFSQSNMRCLEDINLSDIYDGNDVVALVHSSYSKDKHDELFINTGSCSDINSPMLPYMQTCFFVVKRNVLKDISSKCQLMYEQDEKDKSFPLWYDESYFNKYMHENKNLDINFIDGKMWCKNHSTYGAKAYLIDKTCSKEFPLVKPRLLEKPPTVDDLMKNSFVISVDDQQHEEFVKRFKQAGFNHIPQYWQGIKFGKFDDYDKISQSLSRQQHGIIGCSASHISLVLHAKRNDLPYVCIFEDDAFPCEDCICQFKNTLQEIPYFTNVYLLGWLQCKTKECHGGILKAVKHITGSHAYVLFKRGYDEYIKTFSTTNCTADHIFEHISGTYRSKTKLFDQKPLFDGIHFSKATL